MPLSPPDVDARPLARHVAERAAADGAAQVAYAAVDTPVGRLVAAATPGGLARLAYEDHNGGLDAIVEHLASRLGPRIVEAPGRLDGVRRQLDEYFAGRRRSFDVPLDLGLVRGAFARRLLQATAAVPFGQLISYRQAAAAAGSPAAVRAAGNALAANPIPIVVPCHRVVRTGGGLGGYTGGLHRKEALLALEQAGPR